MAAVLFVLAGCGPIIIPYPPPASLPSSLARMEAGEIEAGLSTSAVPVGNTVGGPVGGLLESRWPVLLGAGAGLGTIDLSITGGENFQQGPTLGVIATHWFNPGRPVEIAAAAGLGAAYADGTYRDADDVAHDFAYATLAPTLGGRIVGNLGGQFSLPAQARVSYSRVIPIDGVNEGIDAWWYDLVGGLAWRPVRPLTVALAVGAQGTFDAPLVWFTGTGSLTLRLPLPRSRRTPPPGD